jgi:hypothetical protein
MKCLNIIFFGKGYLGRRQRANKKYYYTTSSSADYNKRMKRGRVIITGNRWRVNDDTNKATTQRKMTSTQRNRHTGISLLTSKIVNYLDNMHSQKEITQLTNTAQHDKEYRGTNSSTLQIHEKIEVSSRSQEGIQINVL